MVKKQHPDRELKPQVKIFLRAAGKILEVPQGCDLSKDTNVGRDIRIAKVLDPTEYSFDLQELVNS